MSVLKWEDYAQDPSPDDLEAIYSAGFQGTIVDAAATMDLAAASPTFYEEFPELVGGGAGRLSAPYRAVMELDPEFGWYEAQTTGDCFCAGTLVRMADGTENPIEQVQMGDLVVTRLGTFAPVVDLICKPFAGELVKIRVEGYHRELVATPDHRITTYQNIRPNFRNYGSVMRHRSQTCDWTAMQDITVGAHVLLPRFPETELPDRVFDLAQFENVITDSNETRCLSPKAGMVRAKGGRQSCHRYVTLDERLAWLIGLYLAEGSMDFQNGRPSRIGLSLAADEVVLAEQAKHVIQDVFGVHARAYQIPSKPSVITVRCNNSLVAEVIHSLCAGNVYRKRVPACILRSRDGVRMAALRGWMDGDGCLSTNERPENRGKFRCKLTGVSVSESLTAGMFSLANSLGLRATITRRRPRHRSREAFDLHLYGENALQVYEECRAACKVRVVKRDYRITTLGLAAKVKSVERVPFEGKVYCLGVDGDHSFQANGFAVHNCVSHSTRNAGMIDYAIDAMFGETEWKGRFATENIYGARGHSGQGAACSRLAIYVGPDGDGGFLPRASYASPDGSETVDLSTYRGSTGAAWGGPGTPAWLNLLGNKAEQVFLITTLEEARDALAAGIGLSRCGWWGYSRVRNEDGVSAVSGRWAHAMAIIGFDDTTSAVTKYQGGLALVQNSWGRWNSGPTRADQPDGSFWVAGDRFKAEIEAGGVYGIASVRGFNRELVLDTAAKIQSLT